MSLIGSKIDSFNISGYFNKKYITLSDKDLLGKWSVLLFYPADFSTVCPTELEDLQNNLATFKTLGVSVFAISTDKLETHKRWHDTSPIISKVEYPLLSDEDTTLSQKFDVLDKNTNLSQRGTFIIDPDGNIVSVEISSNEVARSTTVLISKIKAAQFVRNNIGEVCPANWSEESTFIPASLDIEEKL